MVLLCREGGGLGGWVGKRSAAYEDCSNLALNAAGEATSGKVFQSLTLPL